MSSNLICLFGPRELEFGLLLSQFSIGLLYLEQALHDFWFGHLEITIPGSVYITLRVDTQGVSRCRGFRYFACSFACLSSLIGGAVFAIIGVGLLVFQ